MEIKLPHNSQINLRVFLQRCGYSPLIKKNSNETAYIKRLSGNDYPRLHLYLKTVKGQEVLNLHLDQKRVSYPNMIAHNAEYESQIVEREALLIQRKLEDLYN